MTTEAAQGRPPAEGDEADGKDEFHDAMAAAEAALNYARGLAPGIARFQALKEAGKLRSAADQLQAPKLNPRDPRSQTVGIKRRGAGRPATGAEPGRSIRLSDQFMANVEAWALSQEDQPSRSEAIRRLVELGLKVKK